MDLIEATRAAQALFPHKDGYIRREAWRPDLCLYVPCSGRYRWEFHYDPANILEEPTFDTVDVLSADWEVLSELPKTDDPAAAGVRAVWVPKLEQHDGNPLNRLRVRLRWVCPVCDAPRGEPESGWSFDGSRRLEVDTWVNPCGHTDKYSAVRLEAKENGLNG